ncbi:general stress protein [Corynebacterium sp. CCUG 70398]|uniref:general stress protein n=1 Tax=Corynebacterium sp. CCUG 70398 TaxID=2823891 RepID=UPI002108FA52|nr:general stress protein [Corynebacterium sp. CCUG 70398]MCQ4619413.1 hypothetical protein [Corynebacterium pseudogenitalium]MCQ4621864.1 hypothetical protein [Corynebacterium sp. CCUG 70398]
MTQPYNQQARPQALQRPSGWPVGSFNTYAEAQAAVDGLSDREFPVENLTIVGVDLMQVEKVTGRLTWGRVLGGGALSGLWLGLFVGLLFAMFSPNVWGSLFTALVIGVIFGLIFAAAGYTFTQGKRDFSSMTTIVAGRYDVLCEASQAPRARDMINQMGKPGQPAPQREQIQQGQPREPHVGAQPHEPLEPQAHPQPAQPEPAPHERPVQPEELRWRPVGVEASESYRVEPRDHAETNIDPDNPAHPER